MAEDAGVINGVGAESLGPQFDGLFACLTGLIIGFYFCW